MVIIIVINIYYSNIDSKMSSNIYTIGSVDSVLLVIVEVDRLFILGVILK